MLTPGTVLESPRGTRIEIIENAAERFSLKREMPPLTGKGRDHRHLSVDESFEILAGAASGSVGGRDLALAAGDVMEVPVGSSHVHPHTAAGQRATIIHTIVPRPRFVQVYSQSWLGWLADGKTDAQDEPTVLQLMAVLKEAGGGTWATGPPVALQKLVTPVLGLVANLLGVRAVKVPR